jgi:hypothetical protein
MSEDQAVIEVWKAYRHRTTVMAEALQTEVTVDPCPRCRFIDRPGTCPGNFGAECPRKEPP